MFSVFKRFLVKDENGEVKSKHRSLNSAKKFVSQNGSEFSITDSKSGLTFTSEDGGNTWKVED